MKPKASVVYRKLEDLKKLEGNPRQIKKEDLERLKESIKNNGDYFEARPVILSDRTGELVIIAGNMRYEASKRLGLKEIPTILLSGLSEEREKEIIIRDNVENGEWDFDILANEWSDLPLSEWGVDVPDSAVGEGIVDDLKNADYVEKENYFIKKPFVLIFYDDESKESLENKLGLEIKNDTYDARDL